MTEQPYFANPLKPLKEKHASVFSLPLTTILKEVDWKKLCLEYVSFLFRLCCMENTRAYF
jgi:hypothetical protein